MVLLGILGVVYVGYKPPIEASSQLNAVLEQPASVDQIAASEVATLVAQSADLSVQANVASLATSLSAKTELAQVDNSFISKPQILTGAESNGVTTYKVKRGDSVRSLAALFGISEDTIRWANKLTSDSLKPGIVLKIPGATGVLHTVKQGDTPSSLATKYKADKDRIITFNNAELTGLRVGSQIIIPGGILPESSRPGFVAPNQSSQVSGARVTIFGGNTYAYGYCTWYAFNRRAEIGKPIGSNWGNANTWAAYAASAGFKVNNKPSVGAVIQNGGGWGGYGHVGIVERVNSDGSILVSDMNYAGWNIISHRTVPASSVPSYQYIH